MLLLLGLVAIAVGSVTAQQPQADGQPPVRFKSAVDLVNVTVTVTDGNGRFVPNLSPDDFRVYDDGREQPITQFSSERVPVSLGIALDTSSSMAGEKMAAARDALRRFLFDLLDPQDEVFLYRFSNVPELLEGWTTDRARLQARLNRLSPDGGTAMYDAVAESVPLAQRGGYKKKALLIISDGNDTNSETTPADVNRLIRETDVLVYAIGIDGQGSTYSGGIGGLRLPPRQPPAPFPFPGGGRGPAAPPRSPVPPRGTINTGERVDAEALRAITDGSGGRTEIVRWARDLDPATSHIADELSRQYSLAFAAPGRKDGRWHAITVEVRGVGYRVRARRGYTADRTP